MPENRSPHILNTSANLLGLCFVVLTSIKVSKMEDSSIIDETTALAIILFMTSCILSFLAMRAMGTENVESVENLEDTVSAGNLKRRERIADKKVSLNYKLEKAADFIFLSGLVVLFLTTMIVTFDFII